MTTLSITVTECTDGHVNIGYKARANASTTPLEAEVCKSLTEMFKTIMLKQTGRRPDKEDLK